MDIIAGASLARPTVNLPLSVVKNRLAPGQFAARKRYRRNVSLKSATNSSNPSPSRGESPTNRAVMVPLEAGYDRAEMIQPAVMAPPLN